MPPIIVPVPLTRETHQVLAGAARQLSRLLSPGEAPDVVGLIQHELNGRSVRGLVDEYLDATGRSAPVRVAPRRCIRIARRQRPALRPRQPRFDPTRN